MTLREEERLADVSAWLEEHGTETVVVAGADTNGVLRGKRMSTEHFRHALAHGMPLCDVFWVMDVAEEALVERPAAHVGYFPTKAQGYPDILAHPELETIRVVPWHERTALVLATFRRPSGEEIAIDPRTVLRRVIERARALGYEPYLGLELEFYALRETPETLAEKRYTDLTPLHPRPYTYGVFGGGLNEPLLRRVREQLAQHGIPLEGGNPETGPGQIEMNVHYGPALEAADNTVLYKNAIKELVAQAGLTATFMAKPHAQWAGNSCHLHLSLRREDANVFWDGDAADGCSQTMRRFLAGQLATMRELTAVVAPTVNSYKRYVPYSWAATSATWGFDNRSTGLRAVLEGPAGTRVEHRQAGGDVNPYLAAAAALAAGLHGIERELEPPPPTAADAYALGPDEAPPLPRGLGEALELLDRSETARELLGAEFVDYYVAYKRAEVDAANAAVTDWEVRRYLEML